MVFDILIKPIDSYWHKKYLGMERERSRAESNLRYSESIRETQEADLSELSKKEWMQQQAIRAFNVEREKHQELVETLQRQLGEYQQRCMKVDRENRSLREKLDSTRRSLAQEYENRDHLMEGVEELQKELAEARELSRRLQEDLDARDAKLAELSGDYDALRAEYEAFLREDGGK